MVEGLEWAPHKRGYAGGGHGMHDGYVVTVCHPVLSKRRDVGANCVPRCGGSRTGGWAALERPAANIRVCETCRHPQVDPWAEHSPRDHQVKVKLAVENYAMEESA
eukprot:GFKZ01003868.1.p1 GENE.GFKZ01003868.1~~GFKZ01003868.1.p1  ORF type:complete len:106 (-),score=3.45 GFKZ01003868.1:560-877(-)